MAGICGLDPSELTLRELYWAAEARQQSEWGRWSLLLSMTYNINRDPKRSEPMGPDDFNPFAKKKAPRGDIEVPFDTLKVFLGVPLK